MSRSPGLTVLEVLIALVVIGVAFGALTSGQLANLQTSGRARLLSEAKAEANRALEGRLAEVTSVRLENGAPAPHPSRPGSYRYKFTDYYYLCPTPATNAPAYLAGTAVSCAGSSTGTAGAGWTTEWTIAGQDGLDGEGQVLVTVRAGRDGGNRSAGGGPITLTVVGLASCLDVSPAPTATAAACPTATGTPGATNGSRP